MRKELIFLASLFAIVVGVYYSSLSHGFTYLDDQVQVVNNDLIKDLSFEQLTQIFHSTSVGMYQPLTTVIYSFVYQFSGSNAFGYHLFSLLFHCLNALLFFYFMKAFIHDKRLLFLLVCIFALHPMQVESVAWVSAFSTLVSTAFYLASLLFYLKFKASTSSQYFVGCLLLFLLACLSKSSAVTLPLILVLIDYYHGNIKSINWLNKIPFIALSIAFGVVTILSRESAGHLSDLSIQFGAIDRLFLVAYSILFYPFKFLFPFKLSAFYPYPDVIDGVLPLLYYLALPVLLVLIFLVFKFRNNAKILFGSLFFLATISLVIQIIPVGNQLTTDRYLYLTMLGLLMIAGSLLESVPLKKGIYALFAIPLLLGFQSMERSKIWESDQLIWQDVIKNYPNVAQAYNNLGSYILKSNQNDQALVYFNKAIALKPYYADAYSNRGNLRAQLGRTEAAIADYNQAINLRPHADAYFNRGNEFSKMKDFALAIADYTSSIELKPSADAYTNRAFALLRQGNTSQAKKDLNQSINQFPLYDRAYFLIGLIYRQENDRSRACQYFYQANNLGNREAAAILSQYCSNQ